MKNLHLYKLENDYYALFNSLNLKLAYGNKQLKKIYEKYQENALKSLNEQDEVTQELIKHHILLTSLEEEKFLLKLRENANQSEIATIYLLLTLRCNLNCNYCIVRDEIKSQDFPKLEITDEEISSALKNFYELSKNSNRNKEIVLYGGEPFLFPEKIKLVGKIVRNKNNDKMTKIFIVTNGTLLSNENIKLLKEYSIFPIVSIDGRDVINSVGRGKYNINENLERLKTSEVKFAFSITIGKHNINSLETEVEYLIQKYEPIEIGLNNYLHCRIGKFPNKFEVLGPNVVDKILSIYTQVSKAGVFVEQILRRIRPLVTEVPRLKDCPICGNKIVILPNKIAGRCEYFSLSQKHLLDFSRLHESLQSTKELFMTLAPINWIQCEDCECKTICGGGCRFDGFCSTGSLQKRDSNRCIQDKYLLEKIIARLYELLGKPTKNVYVPSLKEKSRLFYAIEINDSTIPLQESSRSSEKEINYN